MHACIGVDHGVRVGVYGVGGLHVGMAHGTCEDCHLPVGCARGCNKSAASPGQQHAVTSSHRATLNSPSLKAESLLVDGEQQLQQKAQCAIHLTSRQLPAVQLLLHVYRVDQLPGIAVQSWVQPQVPLPALEASYGSSYLHAGALPTPAPLTQQPTLHQQQQQQQLSATTQQQQQHYQAAQQQVCATPAPSNAMTSYTHGTVSRNSLLYSTGRSVSGAPARRPSSVGSSIASLSVGGGAWRADSWLQDDVLELSHRVVKGRSRVKGATVMTVCTQDCGQTEHAVTATLQQSGSYREPQTIAATACCYCQRLLYLLGHAWTSDKAAAKTTTVWGDCLTFQSPTLTHRSDHTPLTGTPVHCIQAVGGAGTAQRSSRDGGVRST